MLSTDCKFTIKSAMLESANNELFNFSIKLLLTSVFFTFSVIIVCVIIPYYLFCYKIYNPLICLVNIVDLHNFLDNHEDIYIL